MSTSDNLYLKARVRDVKIVEDQLLIILSDGQRYLVPLWLLGHFNADYPAPDDAQIIVLRNPPQICRVDVSDEALSVSLTDGRVLSSPLSWFPRLVYGTPEERNHYELHGDDQIIHWPDLDEDIDMERIMTGGPSAENEASIQRWLQSRRQLA